jgi:hypothetical protein
LCEHSARFYFFLAVKVSIYYTMKQKCLLARAFLRSRQETRQAKLVLPAGKRQLAAFFCEKSFTRLLYHTIPKKYRHSGKIFQSSLL